MRIITLILLAVLCAWSPVLTQSNVLKPALLVEARQGQYFQPVTPFRRSAEKSDLREPLAGYQLLNPDRAALQELYREAPRHLQLNLPMDAPEQLELRLVRVDLHDPSFAVYESSVETPVETGTGTHYRGIIAGDPHSVVAISVFENEIMGLISRTGAGNLVLGRLGLDDVADRHVLYADPSVLERQSLNCATPDDGGGYEAPRLNWPNSALPAANCVRVYLEVDHDIYLNKGSTSSAVNYVTGLFNQVATLYANENVNVTLSEIKVWNTPSPYNGTSSLTLLDQFQNNTTNFNGDIGQLLSYQANGGVAILDGLCHPYTEARLSFASIGSTYSVVPTYSWSVLVVAHELGHLLGSQHTHACVWNGNNTAIDGCAGFTEGGCGWPGYPSAPGTIMSYCHLTQAGIDFSLGFGAQPGNVIRNTVNSSACLQACSTGGGSGGDDDNDDDGDPVTGNCGDLHTLYLAVTADDYGPETTWELLDADSNVVHAGGPYPKAAAGETFLDTLCVPDGCYHFLMLDEYGDGICCEYGNGSYELTDSLGQVLATGNSFNFAEWTPLCLNADPASFDCREIDFNEYPILSFGGPQDGGYAQLLAGGQILKIGGNAWKAIPLDYAVTENTVLEFDFGSTIQGEIHGIGLDEDMQVSYQRTFKLHGTQPWGIINYDNYPNQQTWIRYSIPVGDYYTGQMEYLFFVADQDYGTPNATSYFRNVRLHEGGGCPADLPEPLTTQLPEADPGVRLYPNPAKNQLQVSYQSQGEGPAQLIVYDLRGQVLRRETRATLTGGNTTSVDLSGLAAGAYVLRLRTGGKEYTGKFSVAR